MHIKLKQLLFLVKRCISLPVVNKPNSFVIHQRVRLFSVLLTNFFVCNDIAQTHHFFSNAGFILNSFEESPYGISHSVPLSEESWKFRYKHLAKSTCHWVWILVCYFNISRFSEQLRKVFFFFSEAGNKKRNCRKKYRKTFALAWKFGTQGSGELNPFHDRKKCKLSCYFYFYQFPDFIFQNFILFFILLFFL